LNTELIFVFDGPSRPWKRGKWGGKKINYGKTKLLKKLSKELGIPFHHAPGEAEAERAHM
jgi:Holliday junction resolvase YEN1